MRRAFQGLIVVGLAFALGAFALAQPPKGKGAKGDKEKGPKGFQLGKVLPPFIVDELELTEEQEAKIAAIEKEVKAKLEKILTAKQKRIIQNARPPRKGKDDDKDGEKKDKEDKEDDVRADKPTGGIQWFATLESARAEAKRTGRPLLLVSAAPHCSGVSGIW
jgi:Spy/CpxP family protein refolding chaperone